MPTAYFHRGSVCENSEPLFNSILPGPIVGELSLKEKLPQRGECYRNDEGRDPRR